MAAFDDLFNEYGIPTLMEHLGDVGTDGVYLLPRGADQIGPFEAIVGPETEEEITTSEGREIRRTRRVGLPWHSDLPFWNGSKPIGLAVSIGNVLWAVSSIDSLTPSMATLRLIHQGSVEQSRPGYRRN